MSGFSFGSPTAAPATSALPTLGGFSAPTTSAFSLNTGGTLFGSKPATGLGGGISFATPPSTAVAPNKPAIGGFGATAATTQSFGGFSSAAPSAQPAPTLFGAKPGLTFGTAPITTNTNQPPLGFGLTTSAPVSTAAESKIGLGGIDVNATQPKANEGRTESAKVKENLLPQEITKTVDSLKAYIKHQKGVSSDIVRASSRKLSNVTNELNNLKSQLAEIHMNVDTNYVAIKQLRAETSKVIQDAEIAQRTHDTLSGLQFENTAPLLYFMELIKKFETEMLTIRKQLELTENHMRSLSTPQTFSSEDLRMGLQQIHECFIALAGQLQETHRMVEAQNEQFKNFMKHRGKDQTIVNIYDGAASDFGADNQTPLVQQIASGSRAIIPNIACGPTPFSSFGVNRFGVTQKANAGPSAFNANASNMGTWNVQNTTAVNQPTSSFNFANTTAPSLFGGFSDSYKLQDPPIGSKRAK